MDELFSFAQESDEDKENVISKFFDILIVDDDEDVHVVTKAALKHFVFEHSGLNFIDAYSGKEAIEILSKSNHIAVILLDVVMESDDSGLKVAKAVRDDLNNDLVRIILRTGQPGSAPEKDTIINYDINDYKNKSELSASKLFSTMYTALRSYRDINRLNKNKQGLEKIIQYSKSLFKPQPLREFASGVLQQLSSLIQNNGNGALFVYYDTHNGMHTFKVLASTNDELSEVKGKLREELLSVVQSREEYIGDSSYIGYFDMSQRKPHLVFLDNIDKEALEEDKHLIELFAKNIAIAFENVYLQQDLVGIQKELIYSLSDLAENKSKETAFHIKRVSYGSELLAKLYGLSEDEQNIIRLASPMHDIGKIAVPDHILNKPDRLDEEEMEIMKQHSYYGYQIFEKSEHEVLKISSQIAIEHHENYDGTGYPNQIKGDEISIYGKIVAIIDVFDALTHKRCYKEAWTIDDTMAFILENSGKKFDPVLVKLLSDNLDKFLEINDTYPDKCQED